MLSPVASGPADRGPVSGVEPPERGLAAFPVSERDVIDALPRAVIVTAPDGAILLWNPPAEVLYGWTEDEVLGLSVMDVLVPLLDRESGEQIMATVLAGERW